MELNVILGSIVFVVLGTFIIIYLYQRNKKTQYKKTQEIKSQDNKKINKYLKRFCKFKGYRFVQNITLNFGKQEIDIGGVIIGPFGVIAIIARQIDGQVYAYENDKKWVHTNGEEKIYFDNLIDIGNMQINSIRNLFSKNNIYNVNIDKLIIFDGHKLELYVPKGLSVITKNKFKKELKKNRFKKANNNQIDKIYNLLEKRT